MPQPLTPIPFLIAKNDFLINDFPTISDTLPYK